MEFEPPPGANTILRGDGKNVADIEATRTEGGFIVAVRPSREDVKKILAGAPIYIGVMGHTFHPIMVEVADPTAAPSAESITRGPLP